MSLQEEIIAIYASGYEGGHNDTVESMYKDHMWVLTTDAGEKCQEYYDDGEFQEIEQSMVNKVLDAAVEAGWREVHKMPDKDQRHRSIIDPIFEAINKLRGQE